MSTPVARWGAIVHGIGWIRALEGSGMDSWWYSGICYEKRFLSANLVDFVNGRLDQDTMYTK